MMLLEAFFSTVASNVITELFKRAIGKKSLNEKDIERIVEIAIQKQQLAGRASVIQREIVVVLGNAGFVGSGGQLLLPASHELPRPSELIGAWWDTRIYKIVSFCSGKVLDVPKNQMENGIKIQQWDYWGGTNQQWKLMPVSGHDGLFTIRSLQSGKVLDVPKSKVTENGVRIQQWSYGEGMNQHWRILPTDSAGEIFKILSAQSGKALDMPKDMTNNGVRIQQWDYWGGTNQRWRLMPVK